jgi:hypothetical protein
MKLIIPQGVMKIGYIIITTTRIKIRNIQQFKQNLYPARVSVICILFVSEVTGTWISSLFTASIPSKLAPQLRQKLSSGLFA